MTTKHFGVANCTFEVCSAICSVLGPSYIHLPRDLEEMKMKVADFEAKFGIVQPFGAIDGTHIPIMIPSTIRKTITTINLFTHCSSCL